MPAGGEITFRHFVFKNITKDFQTVQSSPCIYPTIVNGVFAGVFGFAGGFAYLRNFTSAKNAGIGCLILGMAVTGIPCGIENVKSR